MEIPIYNSFKEFENNYIIDFAEIKPPISFLKYLDSCKSFYIRQEKSIGNEYNKTPQRLIEIRKKIINSLSFAQLEYLEHRLEDGTEYKNRYGEVENDLMNYYWDLTEEFGYFKADESEVIEYAAAYKDNLDREQKIFQKIKEIMQILDFINLKIEVEKNNVLAPKRTTSEPLIPEPEPYVKETGRKNIPYKLALLRELGILDRLNIQYSDNKEQLYRILDYLTGGNTKGYYLSMYGENYKGKDRITQAHNADLRQKGLI